MSAIPPHSIGSVFGAGMAQQEQAKEVDTAGNKRAADAREMTGAGEAVDQVEETDADTQVHADTGGMGSQGRFDAPPEDQTAEAPEADGITVDENGVEHLDLSA